MKHFKLFVLALALTLTASINSQWTFIGFVTNQGPIPSISNPSQNTVWIAGGTNTPAVWRSTNGGTNFTNVTGTGIALDLFCLWAVDDNTAYVGDGGAAGGAGGNARFYKTTNGGTTWATVLSTGGTVAFINGIAFSRSNPQFGIAQSDPPVANGVYWIAVTTNGGTSWTVTNPPAIPGAASAQNSVMCIDNMFYGFGLNAGASRVSYTSNGGSSWVTQNLTVTGAFISGFAFHDGKQTGIAVSNTSLPNIARTTNASTWSAVNTGAAPTFTGYSHCIWIDGTNICYLSSAAGPSGCIRRSVDGGATWATMSTAGLTGICNISYSKSGTNVYLYAVCSADGSVLKYTDNITAIDPENTSVPTSYSLQQNYPNPFNPSTTIKYSIPSSGYVSLKLYNALGKEVKTIFAGEQTAGNYREILDLSGYSSGIYFYTLISGDYKETRKMMLVK